PATEVRSGADRSLRSSLDGLEPETALFVISKRTAHFSAEFTRYLLDGAALTARPDPSCVVGARRCHRFPVWRKQRADDWSVVAAQRRQLSATRRIPEPGGLIVARRYDGFAVGCKLNADNDPVVPA